MAIDKSLYTAPTGLASLTEGESDLEIEIVDPEEVNIKTDGLEIALLPEPTTAETFNANLADFVDDDILLSVASDLEEDIVNDKNSRKEWEKAYVEGLKLLGLQIEERTEPWNGACGVFHPMITEAVVRFQAETITETFPAQGPVRTKIIGKDTPEIQEAAVRVEEDMNFQLTEIMTEYRPEHERMLWSLPATGSAFKKVYFDPNLGRQVAMFIPAEDILLPYGATDLDTCHRLTHVMRKTKNEIIKLQQGGFYRDLELPDPPKSQDEIKQAKDKETGFHDLNDDRYVLLECHVDLNLKGFEDKDDDGEETGIALPYVVTLIKGTNTILAIRRNWLEDDPLRLKRQHFVHYQYVPGFGAYGFGLFHLIGGFAKNATSLMRQLTDSGTLSNLPGGLKSRGLRIKGDDTPIAPGEWRDVDVASGNIRDSILPLPYKEPSATLFQLMNTIVEEGRRFAATADMKISDMSAQAPVGTTLALLERQLKVLTAVHARVHFAMKKELKLLKNIIRDFTDPDYDYTPEYGTKKAKKDDYDLVDVIPVSDPNASTMSQRVVQYQAVIQMAQMAPDIYDMPELHRAMLDVLNIKNAEKLVPLPTDQKPKDPVSENMACLKGEPLKAFLYQDHQSHIAVHMSAAQDPMMMQLLAQNPRAQQIQAAMTAHIAEHAGFLYRQKIEQQLGFSLPPEDEKLPPQVEVALSTMMAQAAQQVLQQSQAQAAQQQAQQQAQDPLVQMQMQELQLKQQELQLKQQKIALDASAQADRLELDRERLDGQLQLDAMKTQAQIEETKARVAGEQEREGVRLGLEAAKAREQSDFQRKQAMVNQLNAYRTSNKKENPKT
jgi:hypothetical protein